MTVYVAKAQATPCEQRVGAFDGQGGLGEFFWFPFGGGCRISRHHKRLERR